MNPQRIQLSRAKGFSLQEASKSLNGLYAVPVARPGPWGNPFVVGEDGTRAECVDLFRKLLGGYIALTTKATADAQMEFLRHAEAQRETLRGKNLACWCPASAECHAAFLLEFVNAPRSA
jgi:hypothetical protein